MTRFQKGHRGHQRQREAGVEEMADECDQMREQLLQLCDQLRDAERQLHEKDARIDQLCKEHAAATGNDELVRMLDTTNKPMPPPSAWSDEAWGGGAPQQAMQRVGGFGFDPTGFMSQAPMQAQSMMFGGEMGLMPDAHGMWGKMGAPGHGLALPSQQTFPSPGGPPVGPIGVPQVLFGMHMLPHTTAAR